MAKRRRGHYIVGSGSDFKVKVNPDVHGYYGYDRSLDPKRYYVIHAPTGKIVGHYEDESFAVSLAIGMDKTDKKKLADEMEKVLCGEDN